MLRAFSSFVCSVDMKIIAFSPFNMFFFSLLAQTKLLGKWKLFGIKKPRRYENLQLKTLTWKEMENENLKLLFWKFFV